jgi:hypothetical protein
MLSTGDIGHQAVHTKGNEIIKVMLSTGDIGDQAVYTKGNELIRVKLSTSDIGDQAVHTMSNKINKANCQCISSNIADVPIIDNAATSKRLTECR